jgi:outer membrane protein
MHLFSKIWFYRSFDLLSMWLFLSISLSGILSADQEYLSTNISNNEDLLQNTSELNNTSDFKGWELHVLREIALENSPEILVKKAELDSYSKSVRVLGGQYFPSLKARFGYTDYNKIAQFETYSEPEPYGVYDYGLDARWTLYNGYKTRKQIETAELEIIRAEKALHLSEQVVLRKLIVRYFEILNANLELRILPTIEEYRKKRKEIYEKQVQAGLVDKMFISIVNKEIEAVQIKRMHLEAGVDIAKSEIVFLLNLNESFWTKSNNFIVPDELIRTNYTKAEDSTMAELGEVEIQIARSKMEEIRTEKSPTVELFGNTGYRERNSMDMSRQGQEFTVGVKIEFPLFDYFLTDRKLEKASKEIERSQSERINLINQYKSQKLAEEKRLTLAQKNLKYHEELLKLQQKKVEDTKRVVSQGVADLTSVFQEEEELANRKMLVEQSELNALKHQYLLDLIH